MFWHIFSYRFKCLIRDRQMVFWTFLYPLLLATLFSMAFANLTSGQAFTGIPVAVVNNAAYQQDAALQKALAAVSDSQNAKAGDALFQLTLRDQAQAEADLQNNKIKGYLFVENGLQVVVKESGLDQSILKEFADSYLQTGSAYATISRAKPQAPGSGLLAPAAAQDYLVETAPGKAPPDKTLIYFYSLLAMASLFGGFWGKKEISDSQADLSAQGARFNVSPVSKLKALGYSLCAAITIQFLSLLLLVAYLSLVLKVNFGDQLSFVLLTCLAGSATGVAYGALIGAVIRKNESLKSVALIGVSLLLSYFSGMMVPSVKYTVTHTVPVLAYINPANLITDALYSLYYYSSPARFYGNIGLLFGFSVVFYLIVFAVTGRQKYASL
jgi:ABC-2 type transport system permease protein